jgi:membrane protein implicated in regulation of membrane protease activity
MDMFADWLLNVGPFHWLALAALLIGLEMVMPTQYLIWPGIAAAVTGLAASLMAIGWPAQVALFGVLSIVLVVASHYLPQAAKLTGSMASLNQRTDQMIGRTATVAEDFHNGQGAVTVGDTRWSAHSVDGIDFAAGTKVEIVSAESTLLKVKKAL